MHPPPKCNYFIFLQRFCENASVWMYRRALPSYLRHCQVVIGWYLLGAAILVWQLDCDMQSTLWLAEPYHMVPRNCRTYSTETLKLVYTQPLPWSREFEWILLYFFYTIQTAICYVGCLMIANTWTYIFLYIRNTAILENKKSVCTFPHQLVNTCDLHLFRLLMCPICKLLCVYILLLLSCFGCSHYILLLSIIPSSFLS